MSLSFLDLPKDVLNLIPLNPIDKSCLRATCRYLYYSIKDNAKEYRQTHLREQTEGYHLEETHLYRLIQDGYTDMLCYINVDKLYPLQLMRAIKLAQRYKRDSIIEWIIYVLRTDHAFSHITEGTIGEWINCKYRKKIRLL